MVLSICVHKDSQGE